MLNWSTELLIQGLLGIGAFVVGIFLIRLSRSREQSRVNNDDGWLSITGMTAAASSLGLAILTLQAGGNFWGYTIAVILGLFAVIVRIYLAGRHRSPN